MSGLPTMYDSDEDDYYDGICQTCGGEGVVVTCIDDLCHGSNECIHGDGYGICPACKGSGEDVPHSITAARTTGSEA